MKRYEIWKAELPVIPTSHVQQGYRPIVIVSNDSANENSPIITAIPLTSQIKKRELRTCQRRYEIVRKRRRNFVVFRRQGGDKIKRFLAQKECSQFAASGA